MAELIDAKQLIESLTKRAQEPLTEKKLRKLVADGLPMQKVGRKRMFDLTAVVDWLVHNGKAEVEHPPIVFHTKQDIADAIGVHVRTIAEYQADPSFPGRPGTPGTRTAHYPLDEILRWKHERDSHQVEAANRSESERSTAIAERERIQTELKRMELMQKLGTLIDADEVAKFFQHIIGSAKSQLLPLPDPISDIVNTAIEAVRAQGTDVLRKVLTKHKVSEEKITEAVAQYMELATRVLSEIPHRVRSETERTINNALTTLAELAGEDSDEAQSAMIDEEDRRHAEEQAQKLEAEADA